MLVSLTTCDLGVVLEIAGGLTATALAFIVRSKAPLLRQSWLLIVHSQFPAMAYYALTRGPWYSRQKLPAVVCAIFGSVVLVLSCGLTIMKAWTGEGRSTKTC